MLIICVCVYHVIFIYVIALKLTFALLKYMPLVTTFLAFNEFFCTLYAMRNIQLN